MKQIPPKLPRPFDRDRDGLIQAEAATVILESLESALKRGKTDTWRNYRLSGFSSNGAHISNPTVDGPVWALRMALLDAGIDPGVIDYNNAHATSTPAGDASEAEAIFEAFGRIKRL